MTSDDFHVLMWRWILDLFKPALYGIPVRSEFLILKFLTLAFPLADITNDLLDIFPSSRNRQKLQFHRTLGCTPSGSGSAFDMTRLTRPLKLSTRKIAANHHHSSLPLQTQKSSFCLERGAWSFLSLFLKKPHSSSSSSFLIKTHPQTTSCLDLWDCFVIVGICKTPTRRLSVVRKTRRTLLRHPVCVVLRLLPLPQWWPPRHQQCW